VKLHSADQDLRCRREDSQTHGPRHPRLRRAGASHGTADHRADIYSLGVVLYEMLTGERPKEKLEAPPSKRVQVDIRIDEIVLRALEKTPELRFATAAEFRTQVEAATVENQDQAQPFLTPEAPRLPSSVPRFVWIILILAFPVATLLGVIVLLTSGGVSGREVLAIAAAAVMPGLVIPAIILALARRRGFMFRQAGRAAAPQQSVNDSRACPAGAEWGLPVIVVGLFGAGGLMLGVGGYAWQSWGWGQNNGALLAGVVLPFIAGIISGWRLFRESRYGVLGPVRRAVFSVIASLGLVILLRFFGNLWMPVAGEALDQSSRLALFGLKSSLSQVVLAFEIAGAFGLHAWTQRRIQGAATKMAARMTVACFVLLALYFMAPWLVVASAKLTAREATTRKTAFTAGLREIATAARHYHSEYGKWPADVEHLLARHNQRGIGFLGAQGLDVASGGQTLNLRYEPPASEGGSGHVGLPGPDMVFGTEDDETYHFNEQEIGSAKGVVWSVRSGANEPQDGKPGPPTPTKPSVSAKEPRTTDSYHEITKAARGEHREKLATSLLEADHAEIFLLDFDIVPNKQLSRLTAHQSGLDRIPGTKFPIYPMGTTADVLDRKTLTKEQLVPLLPHLAAAVRTEEGGHDWCHFPIHGLRLYRGKEEVFESSFCWVCSTFTLLYPDHSDLHAVRDEELQRLIEQWMPVPATELDRFKAKHPNLFVFRAPEEVMTQVRNDLVALMELPSSFGRGPDDVEKALSDLHAEIARKPKAFEYSREELAAFRKDECPYSDTDMEEAFVRLQAAVNGRPLPGLPAFYRAKLTAGSLTPKQKTICYRMVSSLLAEVVGRPAETSTTGPARNSSPGSLQLRWVRETPSAETEPIPLAGRGQKQTLNVEKTVLLDQSALLSVEAAHKSGSSKIALQLTESGRQRFAAVTREGKGRRLAVAIDGQIRAAPLIMAEISDGRMEISGNLTHEEADDLAARLQTALESPDDQLKPSGKDGPRTNPAASATSPASTAPSGEDHVFDETRHHALRVASKDAVPHFQFAAGKTFLIRTPSAASKDEIKADWDKANAEGGVDFSLSEEAGDILIHPRGCLFGKWVDGMAAYTSSASQTMSLAATLPASTEPLRLGKGQWPVTCLVRTSQGMIGWMTVSSVNEVENKADRLSFEYRLVKKLGGAPQTVSEFYQKANQRWGQGDYKGAVTVYDEAIKQHAAESGFFNNRANAHAALSNYDKALADYAEALRLAPGHSNIHRARSLAYLQMGDYDRAIADLDIAVKADPQGVNFDLRGRAYHAKGDFRAALADYEKGAQVTPGYTFTFVDLAWLLATCPDQEIRDSQKASQYASLAAAALQTSRAEVLVAQAAARAAERNYAEAIQLEQSFLKTLPTESAEAAGSRERLKLYQAHQPLRSPMPIFRSLWR
jgi:tetratricopeptide (TPR) repeat protein